MGKPSVFDVDIVPELITVPVLIAILTAYASPTATLAPDPTVTVTPVSAPDPYGVVVVPVQVASTLSAAVGEQLAQAPSALPINMNDEKNKIRGSLRYKTEDIFHITLILSRK